MKRARKLPPWQQSKPLLAHPLSSRTRARVRAFVFGQGCGLRWSGEIPKSVTPIPLRSESLNPSGMLPFVKSSLCIQSISIRQECLATDFAEITMGLLNLLFNKQSTPSTQDAGTQEDPTHASIAIPLAGGGQEVPYELGMYSATVDRESYLASDENEWILYMRQPLRKYRKPGVTLREEYHQWLSARARTRRATSRPVQTALTT
jgi:hypothetical protein